MMMLLAKKLCHDSANLGRFYVVGIRNMCGQKFHALGNEHNDT